MIPKAPVIKALEEVVELPNTTLPVATSVTDHANVVLTNDWLPPDVGWVTEKIKSGSSPSQKSGSIDVLKIGVLGAAPD